MKSKNLLVLLLLALAIVGTVVAVKGGVLLTRNYKNVVLIMIDTLRADHLGVYGYKRNTSPWMDSFAKQNNYATRAIAVAPWTAPSVASILTGLSIARHGHNPDFVEANAKKKGQMLRDDVDTLAELMKSKGYQTAGSSSNPWISREFKFDQGFDKFFYQRKGTTENTLADAKTALEGFQQNPNQKFFLYVHILDPHGPRTPSAEYAAMFTGKAEGTFPYNDDIQHKVNLYDAEIRSVDDQLAQFFELLKSKGLYDDSVIVVVSDHGEQFDEHGDFGHGKMLHIEEVHIPFMVQCPGKHLVVNDVVSNLDVTPTIIDCSGVSVANKFDGISIFDQKGIQNRAGAYSSVRRSYIQEAFTSNDGNRLIMTKGRPKENIKDWGVKGLFDMVKDPWEINPSFDPQHVAEMRGYLESAKRQTSPASAPKIESKEVSNEAVEQLETLGYINE